MLIAVNSFGQNFDYSRVKIILEGHAITELSKLGIDITEGEYRQGYSFTSDFSVKEIEQIKLAGFKTEIIIADVKQYYRDQNKDQTTQKVSQVNTAGCGVNPPDYAVPSHFSLGSYAGYFTYEEMKAMLDSMVAQYPNLITMKQPIGTATTIEGRDIYYVKISDNPSVNEGEPKVLYSAVHHAREPGGMSQMIFYMYYLLENYSNPDIQALVDNTEMFFVPCVNPDGYIENETTDPAGGGLWRKNKRDNLDGTFGVDLNRNYGYNWGYDDNGSSPFTSDNTYRGTADFSEPETQLMRDFAITHQFKLAFNYHTYSNLLIYPWGFESNIYTPDSSLLSNYGELLTRYNGYRFGTANQTVNYMVNGNSDDWMYGDQIAKPKVFAMTPEVGEPMFGFWPPSSEIIRLCKENVYSNLTLARLAGKYATAEDLSSPFMPSASGYVKFNLQALGLDTSGTFTVDLIDANTSFASQGAATVFSNLSTMQVVSDSISYVLNPGIAIGDEIKYVIRVFNGLYYVYSDTITKYFGTPTILISDNGNNLNNWSVVGSQWGTDNSQYFSASSSISDSPQNVSFPGTNSITLASQVSLSNALHAVLTFYTRWEIENIYDYAQLLISTNNGLSWIPLCGKYTHPSANGNIQGQPVYDGFHTPWVREEINLDDYIGQNIRLKFELTADGFAEYDGFFFDDLQISILGATGLNDASENSIFLSQPIPNPSNEAVTIQYNLQKGLAPSKLEIRDALLHQIFVMSLNSTTGQLNLDVSKWSTGVYFYRIINKEGTSKVQKMVVE